jgi:hypothetical protein
MALSGLYVAERKSRRLLLHGNPFNHVEPVAEQSSRSELLIPEPHGRDNKAVLVFGDPVAQAPTFLRGGATISTNFAQARRSSLSTKAC